MKFDVADCVGWSTRNKVGKFLNPHPRTGCVTTTSLCRSNVTSPPNHQIRTKSLVRPFMIYNSRRSVVYFPHKIPILVNQTSVVACFVRPNLHAAASTVRVGEPLACPGRVFSVCLFLSLSHTHIYIPHVHNPPSSKIFQFDKSPCATRNTSFSLSSTSSRRSHPQPSSCPCPLSHH